MKRAIIIIVILAVASLSALYFTHRNNLLRIQGRTALRLTQNIRNSDIKWDGNVFGLFPHATGQSAQVLAVAEKTSELRKALVMALKDEDRFVAAHVLLTEMTLGSYSISADKWNGLRVELLADGSTKIPTDQRDELIEFWSHAK